MKIAFIGQRGIPSLGGGPERHVEGLAKVLAKRNHNVFVYARPYYTPSSVKKYKKINILSLPTIREKHLDAGLHSFFASIHVLFKKVDVINYQAIGPAFFSFIPKILQPRVKIIVTSHGFDWQAKKWGFFARNFLKLSEKVALRTADEIVAVSLEVAEHYKKFCNKKITYIANGVEAHQTNNGRNVSTQFKVLDLQPQNYILSMSRLVPEKGVHYTIQAFKKVKTNKKLVIAGSASYTENYVTKLKQMASGDKRIIFTGNVTGDLWMELYLNAALFVQSSEREAASFSLLEAISFKKPVLVSDIKGHVDVIGKYGYTFKNKNIKDLQKKLSEVLKNADKAEQIGKKAYRYILPKYDWEKIATKFESIYAANNFNKYNWYERTKRTFDFVVGFLSLIISLPLLLIIALVIKFDSKGPIFFTQERIGRNFKKFTIYKFRTMHSNTSKLHYNPKDFSNGKQITTFGRLLRLSCLDEIPQFLNIIKGDMSFVGPRPEQLVLRDKYKGKALRRFSVTPGLTGLWQISGKKNEHIFEHLEYDLEYLLHRSFFLDLGIIIMTPVAILQNVLQNVLTVQVSESKINDYQYITRPIKTIK